MRANLKLVKPSPTPVNGTVPPRRACNADVRPREYLTPKEVDKLIKASRARGRYGARDALAILMAYRHGLRASELAELRWDQVDFDHGLLHVRRKKNGMPSVHPLSGDELRALRVLRREHDAARYVFMTERGSPMSAAGFRKMLARTGNAVQAWQVTGASAVRSRFEAQHGIDLTPLVGREEELELLMRRWRHAASGEGRVVL
jgi:type 1 fimbriae regulatory protein FimB/type 1 fimbriae regulatory protein FimE